MTPAARPGRLRRRRRCAAAGHVRGRASAISTSTSRSARTAAGTATSSPPSAAATSTGRTSTRSWPSWSGSDGGSAADVDTVFVGGGTPTFTEPDALRRVLDALPASGELTVEANPETVTPELAALLREGGVNRVSLGAQSFRPELLQVLERVAGPGDVRRAVHTLRDAGFDNISLDLIYGIPGQSAADLDADLADALALEPEHLSCYELEAKPGTRFTHAHGEELARQAEAMEGYVERVVDSLTRAGYRWYETANFCRIDGGRELRAQHNLAIWRGADYLGVGVGAVSTLGEERRRNLPVGRALYVCARARARLPRARSSSSTPRRGPSSG